MRPFRALTEYLNILVLLYRTLGQSFEALRVGGWMIVNAVVGQIYYGAWRGLSSIVLFGLGVGSVFSLLIGILPQAPLQSQFSANIQGVISVFLVVKLVGPLVVMLVAIARSGTAVCIEISYMKLNNEIDSLTTMGINPIHFLLLPRIVGMTLSLLILDFYFIVSGVLGGMVATFFKSETSALNFIEGVFDILTYTDLGLSALYMVGFGLLIGATACYQGLSVRESFTEVPRMTTQTVVRAIVFCLIYYGYVTALALEAGVWYDL